MIWFLRALVTLPFVWFAWLVCSGSPHSADAAFASVALAVPWVFAQILLTLVADAQRMREWRDREIEHVLRDGPFSRPVNLVPGAVSLQPDKS